MDLPLLWYVAIAVLWTGYFVLEGFDFGVGALLPALGRSDNDRRVMINSIGPVWDGNEVWVITAIGATFAAFPVWYSALLSGMYVPFLMILLALIARGVAFEYRGKVDDDRWRARWDACIVAGSALPAFLWGLIFANVLQGLAIDARHVVSTTTAELFTPYTILGGLVTLGLFVLHGAVFLSLKTDGPVRDRARRTGAGSAVAVVPLLAVFVWWTVGGGTAGDPALLAGVVAVGALVLGALLAATGREGWAFTATAVSVAALSAVIFVSLFPHVLPSTIDPAFSLDIRNASSAPYTLTVMSWVATVFLPVVIAYQAWSYWVFRRRVRPADIPAAH